MRIAFILSLALLFVPAAVTAAPLALSDHATATKSLGEANVGVQEVGWRRQARRCGAYVRPYCCAWTCYSYYRPYQYYYWQQYYPYGGPLFY